ncbi:SAM-dependent methyltransferase, MidA [hydrothermal vent metagenome]|uniref:SAM-dependent methyltransferase, MidA n=1 Tax=hydrothermal vent metagenome TaxID=652676 RepID=A0A3B0WQ25_9ZZZZ
MISLELPEPSKAEVAHSEQLCEHIKQSIQTAGGWLSFEQYMQLALYTPGMGYYSGGLQKFGEQGDFITSPEVSPLFAKSLARPVAALLADISGAKIIEFGAGSGRLAADLLAELANLKQLPVDYYIVELSAELQHRQREALQQQVPELLDRVKWLSHLPENKINAIVLANEVLDAMPVKRFVLKNNRLQELGVENVQPQLQLSYRDADELLSTQIASLGVKHLCINPVDAESASERYAYSSEINVNIKPWIASVANCIKQGAVYLIDYGYPRQEYYSTERVMGTFMGYYQHRAMDAPLWYPGLQDLTAFVDFTEVAEAALEAGFDVDGYTSQGNFLLSCGLADIVEQSAYTTEIERLQILQQMKTLSLPGEMGERFKVMGLSKGLDKNIPGFEMRDLRYSL